MSIKITREQLTALIKEEVDRYNRIQELQNKKQQLDEVLQKLDEGENVDELFGGLKHLFNKGTTAVGNKMQQGAKAAVAGTKALGKDFVDVGNQAVQGIKNAGNAVSQTYQHGERISKTSKTQKALNAAYAEKRALDAKIKALQGTHQELTGQPYTPTRLNYKSPQALPPQAKPQQNAPLQAKAAE